MKTISGFLLLRRCVVYICHWRCWCGNMSVSILSTLCAIFNWSNAITVKLLTAIFCRLHVPHKHCTILHKFSGEEKIDRMYRTTLFASTSAQRRMFDFVFASARHRSQLNLFMRSILKWISTDAGKREIIMGDKLMNTMLQQCSMGKGATRTSFSQYYWMPSNEWVVYVCVYLTERKVDKFIQMKQCVACCSNATQWNSPVRKFKWEKFWHRNGVYWKLMVSFNYQWYIINLSNLFCDTRTESVDV